MKYKLLLVFSIITNLITAQETVEISGQIKDAQTKVGLEFCAVRVYNTKDSMITGGVTDAKGFFTIPIAPDTYHVVITCIGYKADITKPMDVQEKKYIGTIKLQPDATLLKEIDIKASAAENKLDKDVQIVTDKMKVGAASAKEVLEKVNGVSYDRFNNAVKVDNKSNVIILVDGLEKNQEYIKNLSPDRLKKIEIIRDPGGRYGLEGYSAVINIILKQDYTGTEIFASEQTLQDVDAVKNEYIPLQNEANLTLNYVHNKVNLYGSYNNNFSNINFNSSLKKEYSNGDVIENKPVDNKDVNFHVKEMSNDYTLGADYYLNPKHTISFESNLSSDPIKYNSSKQLYNVVNSNNGVTTANYNSKTIGTSGSANSANTLYYIGKLDENNQLNANVSYSFITDSYTTLYSDDSMYATNQQGENKKNATKFYLEYTHSFKNKSSLQLGYGNSWQQQNNVFTEDTIISKFKYSDIRHKLYGYYSWQMNKKFGIKLGAAGETSSPDANGITNHYFIVQPYADIKYAPSDKLDFKLKYRADNKYPSTDESNPFTTFVDRQSVKTGNPFLKPEVTNKLSMQIDILGGLITVEPYYHFSNNYITETGTLRTDNTFEYSYTNSGNYTRYGSEIRFTAPLGKYLFLQSDADIFNNSISYENKINQFNFWTMSSQLIYQNEKKGTVAGLKYQKNLVRNISAQGYENTNNDFWIAFVQQPFFKEKLNVMLLYFIPTGFGVDFNQGSYIKTPAYTETKNYDISILKNMLMLQVSYRFTKGKSANKTEKKNEMENEKTKKGIF